MAPINPINEGTVSPPTPVRRTRVTAADSPAPATPPAPDITTDRQDMAEIVAEMQQAIAGTAAAPHTVAFRQDGRSNDFVIEIRDPHGELIKQFPPEKVLNLRRQLDELTGMVIDQMT